MNVFQKTLASGLAVAAMGLASYAVQAQSTPSPAPAQGGAKAAPAQRAEDFQARMERRAKELHAKLKLTPQQEPAWTSFVAAMKPGPRPEGAPRFNRAEWDKLSAPERMERQQEMMKRGQEGMARRTEAVKTFYAALTPEQQKIFNDNFMTGRDMRRHFRHGEPGRKK